MAEVVPLLTVNILLVKKRITVAGSGHAEYQKLVFLHEICHAIIEAYVSPDEHDEKFVEAFSKGLYQVIVDNQEVFGG